MRYLDRALGTRQVGKTTLVRHVLGDWEVVTLDPAIDIANARSEPDLFLSNFPPPLVVDEIQYAPEQVLRSARESLAGRAVFLDLEGFSLHELGGRANTRSWLIDYLESPREFIERSSSQPSPLRR